MTTFLASISPAGWVCILLGSWIVLAVLVAPRLGRMLKDEPVPEPELVNWLPFLPPVSPTQADIDAMWLADQPTDLTDQQVDRLFDDIVAMGGLDR